LFEQVAKINHNVSEALRTAEGSARDSAVKILSQHQKRREAGAPEQGEASLSVLTTQKTVHLKPTEGTIL
jgi:hypothetical protein